MKYQSIMLVVKDIEKAKEFYKKVLDLDIVADFGANVILTNNIALQDLDKWKEFIDSKEIVLNGNDKELYFEEENFDNCIEKLNNMDIDFVHGVKEHPWGQRAVRFYDLDKHIIEVGEPLAIIIKRFLDSGMSIEDTAKRMDVPVEYIENNK